MDNCAECATTDTLCELELTELELTGSFNLIPAASLLHRQLFMLNHILSPARLSAPSIHPS